MNQSDKFNEAKELKSINDKFTKYLHKINL